MTGPGPTRLADYPAVAVNVSCTLCPRRGRYRLARLAARFGPEAQLDDVLAALAGDCRSRPATPRRDESGCGARFEDLDRMPVRDVAADGPVHRRRLPAREDVPQARRPPTLSDWTAPRIVLACEPCGRRDVFETAVLRAATVSDVGLDELRRSLAARCPRLKAHASGAACRARLVAEG